MQIYAYRCEACGHSADVLQKISDTPLSICPSCGADSYRKKVTEDGLQLKGSGWYATDFRGGQGATSAPATSQASDSSACASCPAASTSKD